MIGISFAKVCGDSTIALILRYSGVRVADPGWLSYQRCSSASVGAGGSGAAANGNSTMSAERFSNWLSIQRAQQRLRRRRAGADRAEQLPLRQVAAHHVQEARLGQAVVAQHRLERLAVELAVGAVERRHREHRLAHRLRPA